MAVDSDLSREFKRLRRGRGVGRPDLSDHLGPEVRRRCRLDPSTTDAKTRAAVTQLIRDLTRHLSADLQAAAAAAFATDPAFHFPTLEARIQTLCAAQHIAERTARRRIDTALRAMVRAAEETGSETPPADPGWRVTALRALFRLDTTTPELYEIRTIAATRETTEVVVRFSLPTAPEGDDLVVDALFGARVLSVESRPDNGSWRVVLKLPAPLRPGDEHEFWLRVVLPAGRPIWSHYAVVPLDPCESCTVRVRFAPGRLPSDIWLLDGVPYTDLCDERPSGERLQPTALGDVSRDFGRLREGFGYGVGWRPGAGVRQ
jgi:hypothetical protein